MDGAALRRLFTLANAFKEGDLPVGGTADDRIRHEARQQLRALTCGEIRRAALVDDGVTAALSRSRDRELDAALEAVTIEQLKATLLGVRGAAWLWPPETRGRPER